MAVFLSYKTGWLTLYAKFLKNETLVLNTPRADQLLYYIILLYVFLFINYTYEIHHLSIPFKPFDLQQKKVNNIWTKINNSSNVTGCLKKKLFHVVLLCILSSIHRVNKTWVFGDVRNWYVKGLGERAQLTTR